MQSQTTFSLSFWVSASRKINNEVSVYARITVNGKRANISLQRKVIIIMFYARFVQADGHSYAAQDHLSQKASI